MRDDRPSIEPYERDLGPGLLDDHWPWWSLSAFIALLLVFGALYRVLT